MGQNHRHKVGTRLGFFDGGENSDDDWQKEIVSNSDEVEVRFRTDDTVVYKGWRLDWGVYKVSINCFLMWHETAFQMWPPDSLVDHSIVNYDSNLLENATKNPKS